MKRKILVFYLFCLALSGKALAQEVAAGQVKQAPRSGNSVYLEFLGNALLGSVNYERLIHFPNSTESMTLRAGLLLVPVRENDRSRMLNVFVPLEMTFLMGDKEVRPEFGGGVTLMHRYPIGGAVQGEKSKEFLPVARIGCRYTPENKPIFFRVSFHILAISYLDGYRDGAIFPWIGSGVGYTFGK